MRASSCHLYDWTTELVAMLPSAVMVMFMFGLGYLSGLSVDYPETWYVMDGGKDENGCGNSTENACKTLLYLLQQVNRTHLPPDKDLRIVTDKSLVIDQQAAEYLNRSAYFDIYLKSSATPTIDVSNLTLSFNETFQWIFSGLNVNVSQSSIASVHITVKPNDTQQLIVETATITIHNSSFGSLDLEPEFKAQINQCYIDGQLISRKHLIMANNSEVSIQNSQFENFINKNGSTILFGHNNSHVTIENSNFIQHNSSKGVLLLRDNSSMCISNSLFSHNVATFPGYSPISFDDGAQAVVNNTVFNNNSAFVGGAVYAGDHCQVTITKCTFISNKAITEKALNLPKNPPVFNKNNIKTFTPINPVLFNETLLHGKKVIAAHPAFLLAKSFILKHKSSELKDGIGGAIYVAIQCQLLVTNCIFKDNSAQHIAGAIGAVTNITLDIQETDFVGNKAILFDGGAIDIQQQSHLSLTNCTFKDNSAQYIAGAVGASYNVTLDIRNTKFVGNQASVDGGAIDAQQQVQLRITNCVFEENMSGQLGGAIYNEENSVLCLQETNFSGNRALQGGSIGVGFGSYLHMKSCEFKENHAQDLGGSIAAGYDVVLEIDRSHFLNNSAYCGGAIGATSKATLNVQETTFMGNNASSDSGAIYVQDEAHLQITHCVFEENIAQRLGGAIVGGNKVTVVVKETNFKSNSAWQGGAFDVNNQAYLQATNCTFKYNYAEKLGGVIFGGLDLVCEINGSYFLENSASQGGAINVQQNANVLITNSRLERNLAADVGGAILAAFNATLILREISFTLNSASDEAGALFLLGSECDMGGCIFHNNTAKAKGGAVFIQSQSSLKIKNIDFTNNNSSDGGAIYIEQNSTLVANMCNYCQNLAKQSGGAIQLTGYSTAVFENCRFLSNHATSGGAVNLNFPEHVYIQGTLLLRNVASNRGGAVAITAGINININNITCVGNQSPRGGCVQIEEVTLILNNSEISDNFGLQYASGIAAYYSRIQILDTIFKQTNGNQPTLYLTQTNISLQYCRFVSLVRAPLIMISYEPSSNKTSLRMSQSSFTLNTSDQGTKIIHFPSKLQVSWMLWRTEFQRKSYHTVSSDKNFSDNIDRIVSFEPKETFHGTISEIQYASASPLQCSNNCWCHYFFKKDSNVLNCSQTNITSLTQLPIPNGTSWLVAKSNHISYLQWSENIEAIQHLDLQNSGVDKIADIFFSKITALRKTKFLNLANNDLKSFPKTLNGTSCSEVYLAGNPIDCNCDMLWFAEFLNTTNQPSGSRKVQDYDQVLCVGGKWNEMQVYKLRANQMGCYPEIVAEWIIAVSAGIGSFLLTAIILAFIISYRWKEVMFLRYKYFGYLTKDKPEENEDQMKYDGFFCFSKDDFRWIREVFMTSTIGFKRMGRKLDLEKDDRFTLHLLDRDSQVGNVTSHNVIDAIEHSKRVIIILSANFLEYEWGMEAFMIAHDRMVKGRKDLLIVILKEKINVDKLPADLRVYIRTHSYIDGTKDWKTMKKRLRFQMPHVPLKVLRGEQDQEDVKDQHYERFQAPGTTTEDAEDDKDTDDDSRTSNDNLATDDGGAAGSVDTVIHLDNEIQNYENKITQENLVYNARGSFNHESDEVEAAVQVHHLPDSDVTSNDDTAPLLTNMH